MIVDIYGFWIWQGKSLRHKGGEDFSKQHTTRRLVMAFTTTIEKAVYVDQMEPRRGKSIQKH
jgi:hypothetical protein